MNAADPIRTPDRPSVAEQYLGLIEAAGAVTQGFGPHAMAFSAELRKRLYALERALDECEGLRRDEKGPGDAT